jgi:hypothetical protein
MPDQYKKITRNTYQKETYKQLMDTVPNSANANRFRGYAPNTVNAIIGEMKQLVEEYTYGAVASVFKTLNRDPTKAEIDTAFPARMEAVKAGLGASYYSLEIWRDYKNLKL